MAPRKKTTTKTETSSPPPDTPQPTPIAEIPKPIQPQAPVKGQPVRVKMVWPKTPIHHPDQNRWIDNDIDGVELVYDNWVRSQINAGLIILVEQ